MQRIGIIGGSGLYEIEGIQNIESCKMETPFGDPSDEFKIGRLENKEVVFLPRHGVGHRFLPTELNSRANIWAMKKLGVEWIISVSAVGSFKKELKPLDIVLIDQFVDRTNQARPSTFFGDGIVAHIMFAHPVCPTLPKLILEASQDEDVTLHLGGTYLNMEGPAFSTKAESLLYKSWGLDVIGMTNLQEAKLAREAEISYATMAMVTDYDCWIEDEETEDVSVEMVVQNLLKNVDTAKRIIKKTIKIIPDRHECSCAHALENAIMTQHDLIPKTTLTKLEPILNKYIKA